MSFGGWLPRFARIFAFLFVFGLCSLGLQGCAECAIRTQPALGFLA